MSGCGIITPVTSAFVHDKRLPGVTLNLIFAYFLNDFRIVHLQQSRVHSSFFFPRQENQFRLESLRFGTININIDKTRVQVGSRVRPISSELTHHIEIHSNVPN